MCVSRNVYATLTASTCIIKEMLVSRVSKDIFLHFFFFLLEFQLPGKKMQQEYFSRYFPFSPFSAYLSKKKKTKQNFTDTELSVTCLRKCNYSCMVCAE